MSLEDRLVIVGQKAAEAEKTKQAESEEMLASHFGVTRESLKVNGLRLTPHMFRLRLPLSAEEENVVRQRREQGLGYFKDSPYSFLICEGSNGLVFVVGVEAEARQVITEPLRETKGGDKSGSNAITYEGRNELKAASFITGEHIATPKEDGSTEYTYRLQIAIAENTRRLDMPYADLRTELHVARPDTKQTFDIGKNIVKADILGGTESFHAPIEEALRTQSLNSLRAITEGAIFILVPKVGLAEVAY